jgi:hypothetical protein
VTAPATWYFFLWGGSETLSTWYIGR